MVQFAVFPNRESVAQIMANRWTCLH